MLMTDTLEPVSASAFPLSVRRVVLDAGHGGTDPGASSISHVNEKEITLDIGRGSARCSSKNGFEVVATRDDDRIDPAARPRPARQRRPHSDIFVSIHVNSIEHTDDRTASRPTTSARRTIRR